MHLIVFLELSREQKLSKRPKKWRTYYRCETPPTGTYFVQATATRIRRTLPGTPLKNNAAT